MKATSELGPAHHQAKVRVRYGETDQMGVVHHANYFDYFEIARTELLAQSGTRYRDLETQGYHLAVTLAECRYLAPARYDDLLLVRTWVTKTGAARVEFAYQIAVEASGRMVAEGRTELASLGEDLRPRRLPSGLRSLLSSFLV